MAMYTSVYMRVLHETEGIKFFFARPGDCFFWLILGTWSLQEVKELGFAKPENIWGQ